MKTITEKLQLNRQSSIINNDKQIISELGAIILYYMQLDDWRFNYGRPTLGFDLLKDKNPFDNDINSFLSYFELHDEIYDKLKLCKIDLDGITNSWDLEKFINAHNDELLEEIDVLNK